MDFNLPQITWTPLTTWLPRLAVFLALGLLLTTGGRGSAVNHPDAGYLGVGNTGGHRHPGRS